MRDILSVAALVIPCDDVAVGAAAVRSDRGGVQVAIAVEPDVRFRVPAILPDSHARTGIPLAQFADGVGRRRAAVGVEEKLRLGLVVGVDVAFDAGAVSQLV